MFTSIALNVKTIEKPRTLILGIPDYYYVGYLTTTLVSRLLRKLQIINDCGEVYGLKTDRKNRSFRRKTGPLPLFRP